MLETACELRSELKLLNALSPAIGERCVCSPPYRDGSSQASDRPEIAANAARSQGSRPARADAHCHPRRTPTTLSHNVVGADHTRRGDGKRGWHTSSGGGT